LRQGEVEQRSGRNDVEAEARMPKDRAVSTMSLLKTMAALRRQDLRNVERRAATLTEARGSSS
jgi:hypothetical protein